MSKILIVYYSRKGENYWNGSLKTIDKGNTERVAEFIQKAVGGELFEVETVKPYSESYMTCIEEAKQELRADARPEIKAFPENFEDYDSIFVGYPNWWGDMPMIMYNFLESYDFSGKTIIPFNTHEGSGQAGTVAEIRELCPDSNVLDGFSVRGSVAQDDGESARAVVQNWLDSNNFSSLIQSGSVTYTLQDIRDLQDFLLAKPTENDLKNKPYDLDNDGVWSVFDLCLMKKEYFHQLEVDATSSATIQK